MKSGTWKEYYNNGKISIECEYENDEEHGRKTIYAIEGYEHSVSYFERGKQVYKSNKEEL
jgi:antitoxin component YwqK of YwqJK toxin-antitoxin module